tara:strand:- start:82 stop:1065 length:984 start_codon:yes stop_codon:yes gene_type:complete
MKIYNLSEYFDKEIIEEFKKIVYNISWYSKIPGGFITNSPKRNVIAYGDGSCIDNDGQFSTVGIENSYWTAGINSSHCTLVTKPLKLPTIFAKIVPQLRKILLDTYPGAIINDNTFTLAVCNYYSQPDMYIAAHTDGQDWYPKDSVDGAIFASLTLYPDGEPENDSYARFQMKSGKTWENITLKHESLLIMSSDILHRVMPHLKSQEKYFKPRINITFRTIWPKLVNPILYYMGISNHSRYYGMPHQIILPSDCDKSVIEKLVTAYNTFLQNHNNDNIIVTIEKCKKDRTTLRRKLITQYKNKYTLTTKINNNMVVELFQTVLINTL